MGMTKKQNFVQQRQTSYEYIEIKDKEPKSDPFNHVSFVDFVILFFAVGLRFLVVVNNKVKELELAKLKFSFSKYFDYKHIIRWALHVASAVTGILVLPEIFVHYIQPKYFEGLDGWTLFGSGVIGFLGYDLVRWIEKIVFKFFNKQGINPNE